MEDPPGPSRFIYPETKQDLTSRIVDFARKFGSNQFTMKSALITFLIWLFIQQTSAQQRGNIAGHIETAEQNPYAVVLKSAADSAIVKVEYANPDKRFVLEQIPYATYFIEVTLENTVVFHSSNFELNAKEYQMPGIQLQGNVHSMKEVKVVAAKHIVERKPDRIIYNVENTTESPANDALVVLQKAPGISVDQDGNISMRGRRGVNVMLNGKMTYLSGTQLANLLRTTTANQIARIEVISNPSSKYDAEGNSGIVNIVMRKDQKLGTNGIVVLSYGRGKYGKSANGVNMNARGKKLNVFSSYNYFNNVGFNDLRLNRTFYSNQVKDGAYRQSNYLLFPSQTHTGKLGVDYQINTSTTLGLLANTTFTQFNPKGDNRSVVEDAFGQDVSYFTSANRTRENWNNYSVNLNFKKVIDSAGSELTMDADYARYDNNADQRFTTKYFTMLDEEYKHPYLIHGDVLGQLDIKAFKADYVKPLQHGFKWEAGCKSSLVKADNNLSYYDISDGNPVFDSTQSNHFIYSENINALYSTLSVEKKKSSLQVGLRTEQTIARGNQLLNKRSFSRNYWQVFPTLFLTHKFSDKHDMGFSFSRRIQRPGYDMMNPFKLFIDAATFKEGNPYLLPQNSYLFELTHTYKQQVLTTFSASFINKSITEVLIPAEGQNNITIQTYKNINTQYIYSLNTSFPLQISRRWKMTNDVSVYYSKYVGVLANSAIRSGTASFNAKTMQMFTLPRAYALQIDAFIQNGERYSFSSIQAYGAINLSVQKSFTKRVNVKLTANDLLYTSRFRGSSTYTDYNENFYVQRDSRTLVLAVTYKYGKNTVPGARRRGTGADDEQSRARKNV